MPPARAADGQGAGYRSEIERTGPSGMSNDLAPDPSPGGVVSCETALACLFRLGAQNGVYAEVGAVRRRNLIDGDTMPVTRLVELAGEFGLRAERARFDWNSLRMTS